MQILSVQQVAAEAQAKKPVFRVPWRPVLMSYTIRYTAAVQGCKIADACMLAAIVTRESGGQNILQKGVPPGPGCGVGLCQITYGVDWSDPQKPKYPAYPGADNLMDPAVNLKIAAHLFLEPALEAFPGNHVAAFAAYNLGINGVAQELAEGLSPDARTTGGDYGHDVFTNWINFTAASLGVGVDWTTWKG